MVLTKNRSEQLFFAWRVFLCGLAFFIASAFWPSPMAPAVYGIAAYDIQAEAWAVGFMSSSALVLWGVTINGRWYYSPFVRMTGFAALLVMFLVLSISAMSAPMGSVVVIFGGLFFVPDCIRFLRLNIIDAMARHDTGRDTRGR